MPATLKIILRLLGSCSFTVVENHPSWFTYNVSTSHFSNRGLQATVEILADVVLRPKLLEEEIDYARMAVSFELEDAAMRPDQEPLMMEAIHKAAFWNNTLGLPKMCPTENVNGAINQAIIFFI